MAASTTQNREQYLILNLKKKQLYLPKEDINKLFLCCYMVMGLKKDLVPQSTLDGVPSR